MVYPKLVVLDLDATVWLPELYTLRRLRNAPRLGNEIQVLPEALSVLQECEREGIQLAVASRTSKGVWARELLKELRVNSETLESLCGGFESERIQIFPGDKQEHFTKLHLATGIPYESMLFFDDALSGRYGNCERVAELGCLSVHTPEGLSIERWQSGLEAYRNGQRGTVVKQSLTPRHSLPCISMAMPYAALLLNGAKVLESRNRPIFQHLAGERCLIRIGHKDWKYDQKFFDDIGISEKVLQLPHGVRRGDIAGICNIGATFAKSELADDDIRQRVLDSPESCGNFLTEVSNPIWFPKGIKSPGKPGIYSVEVPVDLVKV